MLAKVIQITASDGHLFALDDRGFMWAMTAVGDLSKRKLEWVRLPSVGEKHDGTRIHEGLPNGGNPVEVQSNIADLELRETVIRSLRQGGQGTVEKTL